MEKWDWSELPIGAFVCWRGDCSPRRTASQICGYSAAVSSQSATLTCYRAFCPSGENGTATLSHKVAPAANRTRLNRLLMVPQNKAQAAAARASEHGCAGMSSETASHIGPRESLWDKVASVVAEYGGVTRSLRHATPRPGSGRGLSCLSCWPVCSLSASDAPGSARTSSPRGARERRCRATWPPHRLLLPRLGQVRSQRRPPCPAA